MLVDDSPQEMLAEVGHLGVFVDYQHAARFLHARGDQLPVIGKDAAQVDHVTRESGFLTHLIGSLNAERQRSAIADDGSVTAFTHKRADAERNDVFLDGRPIGLPARSVADGSVDSTFQFFVVSRFTGDALFALDAQERLGQ